MDLCSAADDIWLKCVEVYSKVKVVWVPNYEVDLCSIKASQEQKLSAKNVFENHNDVQLKKTMEYFDLRAKDFLNNE